MYPGDAWAFLVVNVLVQVTVVILAARLLTRLGSRWNAAWRHSIYLVALVCVLASPVLSSAMQAAGIALGVRPQIEALLTAEQLTALRDIVYRSEAAGWLSVRQTQDELGLSQEQKASLGRLRKEWGEDHERLFQEMTEKLLAVFTPAQQEKLREEVDRRGW